MNDFRELIFQAFGKYELDSYDIPNNLRGLGSLLANELMKDPLKSKSFPEENRKIAENTIISLLVGMMCNGVVSDVEDKSQMMNIAFELTSLEFLLENLIFYVGCIPTYVNDLKLKISGLLNGNVKESDFFNTGLGILKLRHIISVFSGAIDEISQNRKAFYNMLILHDDMLMLNGIISNLVAYSDHVRPLLNSKKDYHSILEKFYQQAQSILGLVPQYQKIFAEYHFNIKNMYKLRNTPNLSEKSNKLQPLLENLTSYLFHLFADFGIISLTVSVLSPEKSLSYLKSINNLVKNFIEYNIISKNLLDVHFLNSSVDFDHILWDFKEKNSSSMQSLHSILDDLSSLISLGSTPFQEATNERLIMLLNKMMTIYKILPLKLEEFISCFKCDFKVEELNKLIKNEPSKTRISVSSSNIIKSLSKILSALLIKGIQFNQLITFIRMLTSDYKLFSTEYDILLKKEGIFQKRLDLLNKKVFIQDSMNKFTENFGLYYKDLNEPLLRVPAGLSACDILLKFCSITYDIPHFSLMKNLFDFLQQFSSEFFPLNYDLLDFILDSIKSNIDSLPEEVAFRVLYTTDLIIPFLNQSKDIYNNIDKNNPDYVISCILQNKKIYFAISFLISSLKFSQLTPYFSKIMTALSKLQYIFQSISFMFPELLHFYALQLSLRITKITKKLGKIIEGILLNVKNNSLSQMEKYLIEYKTINSSHLNYLIGISDDTLQSTKIYDNFSKENKLFISKTNLFLSQINEYFQSTFLSTNITTVINYIEQYLIKLTDLLKYEQCMPIVIGIDDQDINGPLVLDYWHQIHSQTVLLIHSLDKDINNVSINIFKLVSILDELIIFINNISLLKKYSAKLKDICLILLKSSAAISLNDLIYKNDVVSALQELIPITKSLKNIGDSLNQNVIDKVKHVKVSDNMLNSENKKEKISNEQHEFSITKFMINLPSSNEISNAFNFIDELMSNNPFKKTSVNDSKLPTIPLASSLLPTPKNLGDDISHLSSYQENVITSQVSHFNDNLKEKRQKVDSKLSEISPITNENRENHEKEKDMNASNKEEKKSSCTFLNNEKETHFEKLSSFPCDRTNQSLIPVSNQFKSLLFLEYDDDKNCDDFLKLLDIDLDNATFPFSPPFSARPSENTENEDELTHLDLNIDNLNELKENSRILKDISLKLCDDSSNMDYMNIIELRKGILNELIDNLVNELHEIE
ncbi:hypothetical protein TRFO_02762 [Tritrichomonas foetus]|uniref:Uncharacterized protein n=1 Tax=Tritrichomonas foetus TaxID=1144522 RepID=A0A1J4KZ02_9EUKA|nr:hypothetical protein TRFO_02762 [Tritrichomonas foetus]|eukprot:OHT16481.1 hypothetical protein TRFO_02762 [Tritrichomonas foetus]